MGKTPRPRTLCVTDPALIASKEIQALKAKGHVVVLPEDVHSGEVIVGGVVKKVDLWLGPNCRMVVHETMKYVALALKELGKVSKPVLETQTLEPATPVVAEEDDEVNTEAATK